MTQIMRPRPTFPYRVVPLGDDFLKRVRAGTDDLGQPVEHHVAVGGEPLRDALRRAQPGEAILLASYCSFAVAGPYKEYGPVFVSASGLEAACLDALQRHGASPYLGACFVLRAYTHEERIADAVLSSPHKAKSDLDNLFARDDVAFVLARFATYGCYALRLEHLVQPSAS
ncbi:MAG: DUF1203 domain-containing protein [Telluria sp.]